MLLHLTQPYINNAVQEMPKVMEKATRAAMKESCLFIGSTVQCPIYSKLTLWMISKVGLPWSQTRWWNDKYNVDTYLLCRKFKIRDEPLWAPIGMCHKPRNWICTLVEIMELIIVILFFVWSFETHEKRKWKVLFCYSFSGKRHNVHICACRRALLSDLAK